MSRFRESLRGFLVSLRWPDYLPIHKEEAQLTYGHANGRLL